MKKQSRLTNRYLWFTCATIILFFAVTEFKAQDYVSAGVVGFIVDASTEQPLENVVIQLTNSDTGVSIITRTNSKGEFRKEGLKPGNYEIEIAATAYETRKITQSLYSTRTTQLIPYPIKLVSVKQSNLKPSTILPQNSVEKPNLETTVPSIDESHLSLGKYYALVIGNNDYQYVRKLKFAKTDAQAVAAVLQDKFGFETNLILDSTRQKILSAIYKFRQTLGESDNLLIYYSGHGFYDPDIQEAYWIPVDASTNDNSNWISASDITKNIKGIKARHVIVVSDSCYSGTIDRDLILNETGTVTGREKFLQKIATGKSRNLMASGGNEPVADGGGGKYSVFANAFLFSLNKMESNVFTANEMFRAFIQERVAGNSEQIPEYNALKNSGHESGDFVFIRKREVK